MKENKTIFVTGATGNQGGGVIEQLIKSTSYDVLALVRNPETEKAKKIARSSVKIVRGDLNSPDSYGHYLEGVHAVFSVQTFIHGVDKEIKQGKALADLALKYKVPHFIYSSVSIARLPNNIPHFQSKVEIENHIKEIGIPYTIIRPASLYENLIHPAAKPRILKGSLSLPLDPDLQQEYVSCSDIGLVVKTVLDHPEKYMGKSFDIASDKMSNLELADTFSIVLEMKVKYQKLPFLLARLFMGKAVARMFKWVNKTKPITIESIEDLRKEFPGMTTLKEWIKERFT